MSLMHDAQVGVDVQELTEEEGHELFDRRVRDLMGMSGAEFLRRYDAREYTSCDDSGFRVAEMLIPFAR